MIDFPIIDSHVHLLDHQRLRYGWTANAPKLNRDWSADDFARAAKPYEIEGFVFVEVDVDMPQYLDEAVWIDGLAKRDKRIRGAVACLPMERGASLEPEMARLAALGGIKGVRRLIQNQPDGFALQPGFVEAVRLLPKYRLSFDLCIFHRQMADATELVRRCPEVRFVLDHIGKPGIRDGLTEPWRREIRALAQLPNVVCKLSGVTTEADHAAWTRDELCPYIDHVVQSFGTDRILYGGDWPVSELAGSYLQWLATLDYATTHFSRDEKRRLFHDNAVRVYRLRD